jgi:hypothetical protein
MEKKVVAPTVQTGLPADIKTPKNLESNFISFMI